MKIWDLQALEDPHRSLKRAELKRRRKCEIKEALGGNGTRDEIKDGP